MGEINHELLDKTLHAIETSEHYKSLGLEQTYTWNQTRWSQTTECGTALCFAGWACHLAGDRFEPVNDPGTYADHEIVVDNTWSMSISERAKELLGLNDMQASCLFAGENDDLPRLRRVVEHIKMGCWSDG